jgi:hypothetical protein
MKGSASDPADWRPNIRNKPCREMLAKRFYGIFSAAGRGLGPWRTV